MSTEKGKANVRACSGVVTSASAGVRRAAACAFVARGDIVGLLAGGEVGLETAAKDVADAGDTPVVPTADVAEFEQVEAAADRVECEPGPIDIWSMPPSGVSPSRTRRSQSKSSAARRRSPPGFHGPDESCAGPNAGRATEARSCRSDQPSPIAASPSRARTAGAKHAIQGFNESVRCELLQDGSNAGTTMVQLPAVNTAAVRLGRQQARASASPFRRSISPKSSPTQSSAPPSIRSGGSTTSGPTPSRRSCGTSWPPRCSTGA